MTSSDEDDSQQRFILALVLGLVLAVVVFVIGMAISRSRMHAAPSAVAEAIPDAASVQVVNGTVIFYFATASADLAAGANEALAAVVQGMAAGKKAVISGFHDNTGDATRNEELARQRALAVQQVLVSLGVPADRVELRKPETTTGTGSNAQARRVEVRLGD